MGLARSKIVTLFVVFMMVSSLNVTVASENPKAGALCPKIGLTKIYGGKKFSCIKSGKKLLWNRGIVVKASVNPTPSPTPSSQPTAQEVVFNSFCDDDPLAPDEMKIYREYAKNGCHPPYRFVSTKITSQPRTVYSDASQKAELCNINPPNFYLRSARWHVNYKIRVVGFQTNDVKSSGNPQSEWRDFFSYASKTLDNLTDVPSNYQFVFDDRYFEVPVTLGDLQLSGKYSHGGQKTESMALAKEIIKVADPYIDFTGFDAIYFLPPRAVTKNQLSNFIIDGPLATNEKRFDSGVAIGSRFDDFDSPFYDNRGPFTFVHEWLVHVSNTLDDTYGDSHEDAGIGHFGNGSWGNTSGAISDFLGFDKWELGLIGDQQVHCWDPSQTDAIWIRPLTVDEVTKKLLVIKLSANKAITLQSMRSTGYNYKLPKARQGLLVVTVDAVKMFDGKPYADGQYVVCPQRNTSETIHGGCSSKELFEATLKLGESVTTSGFRITVLESGDFGDVVKIEKVV